MDASNSSINIATIVLLGIFVLVVLSVLTLAVYFFGGSSPLERNAKGRIEAALNPADVLTAHRQHNRLRMFFVFAIMTGFYLVLHRTAPAETDLALDSFFGAVSIALHKGLEVAAALLQGLRSGN